MKQLGLFSSVCLNLRLRIKTILIWLFSISLFGTSLFGQSSYSINISPTTMANTNIYQCGSNYYSYTAQQIIGYVPDAQHQDLYRIALLFNLNQIPSDATITYCYINYNSGDTQYGSVKGNMAFTKLSKTWTNDQLSTVFSNIQSSTSIGTATTLGTMSFDASSSWDSELQSAIQTSPYTIGLGIYNGQESSNGGMSFRVNNITIGYTRLVPPKVTNVHMISNTSGSMVIGWNAASGDVTGYKVYKSGSLYGTTSSTSMQICGLAPGTSYSFYIVAYNSHGDADVSDNTNLGPTLTSSISGPSLLCDVESYSVSNVPTGTTVTWVPPSNMTAPSPYTNPCNIYKYSNGSGTLTVNITSSCENYSVSSSSIHTGPYSSSDYPITGPTSAPCRSYVYYSIPTLPGATSYNWSYPGSWTYVSGQGTPNLSLRTGTSSGMVLAGVNNTCGQSGSYAQKYTSIYGSCFMSLTVTPNPASDEINISIPEEESNNLGSTEIDQQNKVDITTPKVYSLLVTDANGVIYVKVNKNSSSFKMPIQNLKNGKYYITLTESTNIYTSILIVLHK